MTRHTCIQVVVAFLMCGQSYGDDRPSPVPPDIAGKPPTNYTAPIQFSFDELIAILAAPETKSVDDLVERLPQSYRENYAEVFASRSPERNAVAPKTPRIIAYGHEAKLIIAYCGDPDDKGTFNTVQIIRFNNDLKIWEFYSTTVPAAKDARGAIFPLEKNPARCLACHGRDANPPAPIWDSYPLWPGTFGANRDLLFFNLENARRASSPVTASFFGFEDGPAFELRSQYLANKPNLRRYRSLREHVGQRDSLGNTIDAMDEPNTAFTRLLCLRQSEAVARAIKNNPALARRRFAMLASLTGMFTYVPPSGVGLIPQSKESELVGLGSIRFEYPIEFFNPQEPPSPRTELPRAIPIFPDCSRKLALANLESTTLRIDRHVHLLRILENNIWGISQSNDVRSGGTTETERVANLMQVVEFEGVSTKSWMFDFERLTNTDGEDTFINNLERRLWAEIVDESANPELVRLLKRATEFSPEPGRRLLWGGRPVDTFDNVVNEIKVRRHICDVLRAETNKIYPVNVVPNYPIDR